mgnify:CR=1 FL=1
MNDYDITREAEHEREKIDEEYASYAEREHRSDWWFIALAAVLSVAGAVLMLWDLVGRLI